MSFPTTPIIDTFDRANANDLGPAWTADPQNNGGVTLTIDTNQAACGLAAFSSDYLNGGTYGPDCEAYATLSALPGGGAFASAGAYARVVNPVTAGVDGYYVIAGVADSNLRLIRIDNGADVEIASVPGITWAAGDKVGIECIGSSIKGYRYDGVAWAEVASAVDATYAAGGYLGLWMYDPGGGNGRLDDFGGGDYIPPGGDDPNMAPPQLGGWGAC